MRYFNAHSQAPQKRQCFSSARAARSRVNPTSECRNGTPGARSASACGPVCRRNMPTTLSRQSSGSDLLFCKQIMSSTDAAPTGYSGLSSASGMLAFPSTAPRRKQIDPVKLHFIGPRCHFSFTISDKRSTHRVRARFDTLPAASSIGTLLSRGPDPFAIRCQFERGLLPCRAESRATPQPSPNRRTVERACFRPHRRMRASSFSSSERNAA